MSKGVDRFADERSRRYYTLAKRPMRTTENLLSSNTAPSHGRNRRTNTGDRVSRRKSRASIRRQRRLRVCMLWYGEVGAKCEVARSVLANKPDETNAVH